MKVLHLAWEFPPWKVGGIAPYLSGLSKTLVKKGVEVHVVCPGPETKDSEMDGVKVHYFKADFPSNDFISWVLQMNFFMKRRIIELWKSEKFDLIHAHDWLSTLPAIYAKHTYRVPLIATVHDTEQGRWGKGQGIPMINELDWKLTYEAWKISVLSDFMKWHLQDLFNVPEDKIWVIPPGIEADGYRFEFDPNLRNNFAAPWERIVLFVGRMFHQKGCDILVGAAPFILKEFPDVKFVCVGEGYARMQYTDLANWMGVGQKFYFTGFLDEFTKRALMQLADVIAIPSRHEPFGIVALEGMCAGTPVVVADEGGLSNIVQHEYIGIKVWKEHSESLAWGIKKVLRDPELARRLVENGFKTVRERYDWDKNTNLMIKLYEEVLGEYEKSDWAKAKATSP